MNRSRVIDSPIGGIRIELNLNRMQQIDFHWEKPLLDSELEVDEQRFLEIEDALQAYFLEPFPLQKLPHQPIGTPFQLRVWSALREIPLGKVVTYGELAAEVGSSPRAVGNACRRNPIPLIIPCHRVVSKSGIGGFSGQWGEGEKIDVKRWLLRHEGELP